MTSCAGQNGGSAALALMLLVSSAGCGDGRPSRVPVSGHVLIDGQPLEYGNVRFHPLDQRAASAKLGSGGKFTLSTYEFGDGVVLGEHQVTVNAYKPINVQAVQWLAPKKYCGPTTSGLVVNVNDPTDSVEIRLSWDGGKPFIERSEGGGD